jgi:hypothetical protein
MKKTILLLLGFMSAGIFAQSQHTIEMTEKSNDPKVVANFIVNYPTHPKTPEFRKKLARLGSGSSSAQTSTSHQSNSHRSHQETAEEATRILNGSSKGPNAHVSVKNISKCPIVVSFTGKHNYQLNVPANSTGRMSIAKGSYTISSVVCGGKHQQSRSIQADYQLTLGVK